MAAVSGEAIHKSEKTQSAARCRFTASFQGKLLTDARLIENRLPRARLFRPC
jgi:hypothetical protein